jgi:hypothetical protein
LMIQQSNAVSNPTLSHVWVAIDRVWIGDSIYWPLTHSWLVTTLQIIDTQTSVLSLLQSPLAVSWQRILT